MGEATAEKPKDEEKKSRLREFFKYREIHSYAKTEMAEFWRDRMPELHKLYDNLGPLTYKVVLEIKNDKDLKSYLEAIKMTEQLSKWSSEPFDKTIAGFSLGPEFAIRYKDIEDVYYSAKKLIDAGADPKAAYILARCFVGSILKLSNDIAEFWMNKPSDYDTEFWMNKLNKPSNDIAEFWMNKPSDLYTLYTELGTWLTAKVVKAVGNEKQLKAFWEVFDSETRSLHKVIDVPLERRRYRVVPVSKEHKMSREWDKIGDYSLASGLVITKPIPQSDESTIYCFITFDKLEGKIDRIYSQIFNSAYSGSQHEYTEYNQDEGNKVTRYQDNKEFNEIFLRGGSKPRFSVFMHIDKLTSRMELNFEPRPIGDILGSDAKQICTKEFFELFIKDAPLEERLEAVLKRLDDLLTAKAMIERRASLKLKYKDLVKYSNPL